VSVCVYPLWFSPTVISVSMALSCSPPLFLHYHPINRPSLLREAQRPSTHTLTHTHTHTTYQPSPHPTKHPICHRHFTQYTICFIIKQQITTKPLLFILFPLEKLVGTMHPFLRLLSTHNSLSWFFFCFFPITFQIVVKQKCIQFCVVHGFEGR